MGSATAQPRSRPKLSWQPRKQARTRIAFVCLGNSCRSQMAEAWARHLGGGLVEAMSAGVHPLGYITPETIQAMEEVGVSLAGQRSKGLEAIDWQQVDVLVNMSPFSHQGLAPHFNGRRLDWHVEDPFDEPLETYRNVRDELQERVRRLLAEVTGSEGGPAAPPVA